jgi:hypothetical protein
LVINYNFNCAWDLQKKDRISHLLSERVLLILGIKIFKVISSLNFCEKEWFKEILSENTIVLSNDQLAVIHIIETSCIKMYELVLVKDILLSLLKPGAGQLHFDDLILELKNIIQNN